MLEKTVRPRAHLSARSRAWRITTKGFMAAGWAGARYRLPLTPALSPGYRGEGDKGSQVEFGRGEEVFEVDGLVVRRLQRGEVFFAQRDALLGAVGVKTRSPPVAAVRAEQDGKGSWRRLPLGRG